MPLTWTVQAPHWAMPQPNLVPFISRTSPQHHSNGVSAGTSTVFDWPLTVRRIGHGDQLLKVWNG